MLGQFCCSSPSTKELHAQNQLLRNLGFVQAEAAGDKEPLVRLRVGEGGDGPELAGHAHGTAVLPAARRNDFTAVSLLLQHGAKISFCSSASDLTKVGLKLVKLMNLICVDQV